MGDGPNRHCDEAQVGWRSVRRRLRGRLETIQRHSCSQNTQGKNVALILDDKYLYI
jgi:hypothetical protein